MNFKYVGAFFFGTVGYMCYSVGVGTPEIVLILITFLLFGLFGGIIFLIYSIFKGRNTRQSFDMPSNSLMNVTSSFPDTKIKIQDHKQQVRFSDLKNEKVALPQQHEIRYVFVNEIMRCEADDNYTNFFLVDGEKILISKSLKEYSDLLTTNGFLRTHQSHLVNPSFVKSWLKEDGGVLLMNNGDKIPVSKPNRESVKGLLGK